MVIKQCGTIEASIRCNNTKEAYRILKKLTNSRQARLSIIDDKNGKPLVEGKAVAERLTEYCQELYNFTSVCDNDIPVQLQNKQEQEEEADITGRRL